MKVIYILTLDKQNHITLGDLLNVKKGDTVNFFYETTDHTIIIERNDGPANANTKCIDDKKRATVPLWIRNETKATKFGVINAQNDQITLKAIEECPS